MKKVIITGAMGLIGKRLVDYLLQKGVHVYAIVRHEPSKSYDSNPNLTIIKCDLNDIKTLYQYPFKDVDVFFHLAWEGSTGDARKDDALQQKNKVMSIELYRLASEIGCQRFISTGTISEQLLTQFKIEKRLPHMLNYAKAKHETYEMLLELSKAAKTKLVWAQLTNIYGDDLSVGNIISYSLKQLLTDKKPIYSKAEQPYDLMHIDDVIDALYLLGFSIKLRHVHYVVGSGNPRILKLYLEDLFHLFDINIKDSLGLRDEDGFIYRLEWFNIKDLVSDTNFQPKHDFTSSIHKIVDDLRGKTI